jgi:hypothetical protein
MEWRSVKAKKEKREAKIEAGQVHDVGEPNKAKQKHDSQMSNDSPISYRDQSRQAYRMRATNSAILTSFNRLYICLCLNLLD